MSANDCSEHGTFDGMEPCDGGLRGYCKTCRIAELERKLEESHDQYKFIPDEHGGHILHGSNKWYPESHTQKQLAGLERELANTNERERTLLGRAAERTAWTCPQCGASSWSCDHDPACATRWCDGCDKSFNPGEPGYPPDRVQEFDARRECRGLRDTMALLQPREVEEYIDSMTWSPQSTEEEKALARAAIRLFAKWARNEDTPNEKALDALIVAAMRGVDPEALAQPGGEKGEQ